MGGLIAYCLNLLLTKLNGCLSLCSGSSCKQSLPCRGSQDIRECCCSCPSVKTPAPPKSPPSALDCQYVLASPMDVAHKCLQTSINQIHGVLSAHAQKHTLPKLVGFRWDSGQLC